MTEIRNIFTVLFRTQSMLCCVVVLLVVIGMCQSNALLLVSHNKPINVSDLPPIPHNRSAAQIATEHPLRIDCVHKPCLALTFDDGPNPVTTPQILDVLERQNVHATFFVLGWRAQNQGPTLRRMHAGGNEIGNHSWSHPDFIGLNQDQMLDQVNQTQATIMASGVPAPTLFRPPYGSVNDKVRASVPLTFAMWNVDPVDWSNRDPHAITAAIVAQAKAGGVIDLHDIYGSTAQALEPAIQQLKQQYTLVTFSEMFGLSGGQRGEYFGR